MRGALAIFITLFVIAALGGWHTAARYSVGPPPVEIVKVRVVR
jgi:hypothetical protein